MVRNVAASSTSGCGQDGKAEQDGTAVEDM